MFTPNVPRVAGFKALPSRIQTSTVIPVPIEFHIYNCFFETLVLFLIEVSNYYSKKLVCVFTLIVACWLLIQFFSNRKPENLQEKKWKSASKGRVVACAWWPSVMKIGATLQRWWPTRRKPNGWRSTWHLGRKKKKEVACGSMWTIYGSIFVDTIWFLVGTPDFGSQLTLLVEKRGIIHFSKESVVKKILEDVEISQVQDHSVTWRPLKEHFHDQNWSCFLSWSGRMGGRCRSQQLRNTWTWTSASTSWKQAGFYSLEQSDSPETLINRPILSSKNVVCHLRFPNLDDFRNFFRHSRGIFRQFFGHKLWLQSGWGKGREILDLLAVPETATKIAAAWRNGAIRCKKAPSKPVRQSAKQDTSQTHSKYGFSTCFPWISNNSRSINIIFWSQESKIGSKHLPTFSFKFHLNGSWRIHRCRCPQDTMAIMRGIDTKVLVTTPPASRKLAELEVALLLGKNTDLLRNKTNRKKKPLEVATLFWKNKKSLLEKKLKKTIRRKRCKKRDRHGIFGVELCCIFEVWMVWWLESLEFGWNLLESLELKNNSNMIKYV